MASWKNATIDRAATLRGILRPVETAARADLRRDAPVSEGLRPFVERYWSVRWDLTGRPPFRSEVLSHPSVNVSVESGTDPHFGLAMPAVLVHGVVTRRFSIDLTGAGRVTAVKFRPGGFTALTGALPGRNSVRPLGGELGLPAERLLTTSWDWRTTTTASPCSTPPSSRSPSSPRTPTSTCWGWSAR